MNQIYIFRKQCIKADSDLRSVNLDDHESLVETILKPEEIYIKLELEEIDAIDDTHLDKDQNKANCNSDQKNNDLNKSPKVNKRKNKLGHTKSNNCKLEIKSVKTTKKSKKDGKLEQNQGKHFLDHNSTYF